MKTENVLSKQASLVLKGIAILLMFIHHLWGFPGRFEGYFIPDICYELGSGPGRLCVSLFLFLSGYGLTIIAERDGFSFRDTLFRIRKIYLLYWQVFIIFVPIGFIIGYKQFNIVEFLSNFFCIDRSYNEEWWFLSMYIEYLLIFPLFCKIKNNYLFVAFVTITFILSKYISSIWGQIPSVLLYKHIFTFCYYWGTFSIGVVCARFNIINNIDIELSKKMRKISKSVLYISILLLLMAFRKISNIPEVTIIVIPLLAIFVSSLPKYSYVATPLGFLGRYSMYMWLIHSFICYYYWQNILMYFEYPIVIFVVLTVTSLGFSILVKNFYGFVFNSKRI